MVPSVGFVLMKTYQLENYLLGVEAANMSLALPVPSIHPIPQISEGFLFPFGGLWGECLVGK